MVNSAPLVTCAFAWFQYAPEHARLAGPRSTAVATVVDLL